MTDLPAWESETPTAKKWTDAAFASLSKGTMKLSFETLESVTTMHVTGPCPRCKDELASDLIVTIPAPSAGVDAALAPTDEVPDDAEPYDVPCLCNAAHTKRPDGVTRGCGILFRVLVSPGAAA